MGASSHPGFVVGIGASAGGLEAIQNFFSAIPADTGMAFIVVQHLSPTFKSLMDELLQKYTSLPIITAEEGTVPEPNHIYLNRRDKNLVLNHGALHLTDRDPSTSLHLPIDDFFHSLGESYGERAVAVVLSGTGTDGSRGIRTIKEAGGTIMVQEPSSAQFDGMPNATLRTNLPDVTAAPAGLAEALVKLTTQGTGTIDLGESGNDMLFAAVLHEASRGSGIDFGAYKPNTLARRIRKRMDLKGLVSLNDYLVLLKGDDDERQRLAQEFLIGVTAFFRDNEAYEVLVAKVLPEMFARGQDSLRIWVAACSTGEEAYSLAILLDEYNRSAPRYLEYKIFATDVDAEAVSRAASGLYPVNILADVSKERLATYFVKNGDNYQIVKRIRERIVFSRHNLLKDPPFIRMDMITCRNLLIYFNNAAQSAVLGKLAFSLNEGGYVFLGNSESLGSWQDQFRVVDSKWRIYQGQKSGKASYLGPWGSQQDIRREPWQGPRPGLTGASASAGGSRGKDSLYRVLAELFAPSCLIFDQNWNLQYLKGEIRSILRFREGEFTQSLLDLLDETMAGVLRTVVRGLKDSEGPGLVKGVPCDTVQGEKMVDVRVRKLALSEPLYLMELLEGQPLEETEATVSTFRFDEQSRQRIQELDMELQLLRSDRQTMVEELETSNEELQSSNEELLASNEELQSTNEELQSVNEELYTVNAELQQRNRELADLYSDLDNLLSSTRIATLFLDEELRIRRFTPGLKDIFNLADGDLGRSILDFSGNLSEVSPESFAAEVRSVMETGAIHSTEVRGRNGSWYLQRISPFERDGVRSGGSVVTFVDITERKNSEQELLGLHSTLKSALIIGNIAWWEWDLESGRVQYDMRKAGFMGFNPGELPETVEAFTGRLHPDDYEGVMQNMRDHLEGKRSAYEVEYRIQHKDGSYVWLRDRGSIVQRNREGAPVKLLGAVFDITEHRTVEEQLMAHLEERELLLREVHHRVKNNLQKIIALLELQAMGFSDARMKDALRDVERRIFAMSLIHEHLCRDTRARVDLAEYVRELVKGIMALNCADGEHGIHLSIDPLSLDHEETIANGLLINELITNCLKHGGGADGCPADIELRYTRKEGSYVLEVQDHGPGLPDDFGLTRSGSLGMRILEALCAQLGARLSWENRDGALFRVEVPLNGRRSGSA